MASSLFAVVRIHLCNSASTPIRQLSQLVHRLVFALVLLNALVPSYHRSHHSSMAVAADDALENLDHFICLRSNGFFPHDVRCDHFYECRNSTIINEGICKAGLRFDYRYRKKPRCIASDLIDCRITQVDSQPPSTVLYEMNANTGTTPPPTTERFTFPTIITTTTTTTTTTTPAPTTTQSIPTTNAIETTVWPTHMNTRSRSRARNKAKSLQKLVEEEFISSAPEDDNQDDNTLTKKRKLLRKPLKLRRGHLQEPSSPYIAAGHNHLTAVDDDPSPNSLLSRAIASDYSAPPSRHKTSSPNCPNLSGYFADRDDCRKFYACDDGRAFPMSCPLGLAYDELAGTCNWPDMVEGCRSEEMLRFTCPDPYENDILDYGDPRYPTSDCRKFVVCVLTDLYGSRTPRLLGCEEGLVFNPNTKSCDYPENVPSCANYYDTNPAALQANRFRRAQVSLPKKRRARL